jgi:uncharacterized damage-inducible protein DinB
VEYPLRAIAEAEIPRAAFPLGQHLLDTYASETNKLASVWRAFTDGDLEYRPHVRSSTVAEVLRHQLLSERRFFGEFLGTPEPSAESVLPAQLGVAAAVDRLVELARPRLLFFARQPEAWWLARVAFFGEERERIWVFWRRVLHTAHHRTQLTGYLRAMDRPVPSTYGPTADVTWATADPTHSAEAAARG